MKPEDTSSELRLLMRTFKNLSLQQIGVLLIPFKAKQLLNHVLSELTEEQVSSAEAILKEFLFKNIDERVMEEKLDLEMDEGGAGWNKKRVRHFSERVREILFQVEHIINDPNEAPVLISEYLTRTFDVHVDDESLIRLRSFIKLRIENKIDKFGLMQRLDSPKSLGGAGLYRGMAEKIVREMELIMLLKYSA
jgi:hypothetical protein